MITHSCKPVKHEEVGLLKTSLGIYCEQRELSDEFSILLGRHEIVKRE